MNSVFVTRQIPPQGLELLTEQGIAVEIGQGIEEQGLSREQLMAGARNCRALLCLLTEPIDETLLAACPRLLGVANMAVGFDNIDVEAATRLGIPVSNTPGVLTDTTADFTWAMLLAVARHVPQAHQYAHEGRYKIWGPNLFLGADVSPGGSGQRKVLGVIGFGSIGRAVARRASGFDMDVIAYDPAVSEVSEDTAVRFESFEELLKTSDFVTLHPLLNDETKHLIDARALEIMKPTAILINASRGPVVDESALVVALNAGEIAACALDVFEEEPRIHPGLLGHPKAVLFPHVASASYDTRGRMATMAADNVLHHVRCKPAPNIVNPDVYQTQAYKERVTR